MKLDGVERHGIDLSHAILKKVSQIDQEMIYDKTREYIKINMHMVNFCDMMKIRFGKKELPIPQNYKKFLECGKFIKDDIIQIPNELIMKLSEKELRVYCYLSGLSRYFAFYELDWMKVSNDYTDDWLYVDAWREFFRTIRTLQETIMTHPYIEYPILITELSNEQWTDIINCKSEEGAYELLQEYRRIVLEGEC